MINLEDLVTGLAREFNLARERWLGERMVFWLGPEATSVRTVAQLEELTTRKRIKIERRVYESHEELWVNDAFDTAIKYPWFEPRGIRARA